MLYIRHTKHATQLMPYVQYVYLGDVEEVFGVGLGTLVDMSTLTAHQEQVVQEWVEPHTRP